MSCSKLSLFLSAIIARTHNPIPLAEFDSYVREMKADKNKEFKLDFEVLNLHYWSTCNCLFHTSVICEHLSLFFTGQILFTLRGARKQVFGKATAWWKLALKYCNKEVMFVFFQDLPTGQKLNWDIAKRSFNAAKNRFGNAVTCKFMIVSN